MNTTAELTATAATIPAQGPAPAAEGSPPPLLDMAARQWFKGTGRAIGATGDLLAGRLADGRNVRATLPAQVLSVLDVRIRAASDTSVEGAETHPHVAAALAATLQALGTGPAEVQVLSVRTDTPHVDGTERPFVEALAAVRGLCAALKISLPVDEVSRLVSSVLPSASSLALPGLQVADSSGSPVTSWGWWPQYSLVRISDVSSRRLELAHLNADSVLAALQSAVADRSPEAFAAAATSAAAELTAHPLHGLVEETLEVLDVHGLKPLGWVLSTTGTCAALLFPPDMEGRNRAAAASHLLGPLVSDRARTAVSCSPRSL